MINEPQLLAELDAAIASVGFPVRGQAIEQAWDRTEESTPSEAFRERVRRAIGEVVPPGELLLLVTLRARRGREHELVEASEAFVRASRLMPGVLGSTLYQSPADPMTLTLAERFTGRQALEQHMAAEYFERFQRIQAPLLAAPVEAIFYQRTVS
jgi:quinol monooxygenase YgiN